MRALLLAAVVGVGAWVAPVARAVTVSFGALKDNTLYETQDGALSNGAGPYLFAGKTGTNAGTPVLRRGVIAFDVSGIPAGATIETATLTLHLSRAAAAGADNIAVHRLLSNWGEGASNAGDPGGAGAASMAGDATWVHTFFNASTWNEPGGDYSAGASSVRFVGGVGNYEFGDAPMATDVAGWLGNPSSNFGWIIRGNEETLNSAKRFDSREHPIEGNRPVLTVTYSVPEPGAAALVMTGLALGVLRRRRRR